MANDVPGDLLEKELYVPEDIIAHILKLLPVQNLLRFRCVHKEWREMIDSPSFVRDYVALQNQQFIVGCRGSNFVSFDPRARRSSVKALKIPALGTQSVLAGSIGRVDVGIGMIGTLNGVVCVGNRKKILICNPTIHRSLTLIVPDDDWDYRKIQTFGFWIDSSSKDYKILLSRTLDTDKKPCVVGGMVYSSIQNNWRVIPKDNIRDWASGMRVAPVMIGEAAHWLSVRDSTDGHGRAMEEFVVLTFDFRLETFGFIEMPYVSPSDEPVLFIWQGQLSYLCQNEKFPYKCGVYSRRQGSWAKIFGLDLFDRLTRVLWPLEVTEEWDRNHGRVLATNNAFLVLFDTKTGIIHLKSGFGSGRFVNIAYNFVESHLFP